MGYWLLILIIFIGYADGQSFVDFCGYNADKYKQNAQHTYTKFTNIILKIEKAE